MGYDRVVTFPSCLSGHLLQRLERCRIHGERDRVDRECANACDGQPAPEDAPTTRPITAEDAIPCTGILRTSEIVHLKSALDDINRNVDHPRDHAGESASEQHRPNAALTGALWCHAITHELVAGDVDGEAGDLAHDGGVESGEAAS